MTMGKTWRRLIQEIGGTSSVTTLVVRHSPSHFIEGVIDTIGCYCLFCNKFDSTHQAPMNVIQEINVMCVSSLMGTVFSTIRGNSNSTAWFGPSLDATQTAPQEHWKLESVLLYAIGGHAVMHNVKLRPNARLLLD